MYIKFLQGYLLVKKDLSRIAVLAWSGKEMSKYRD